MVSLMFLITWPKFYSLWVLIWFSNLQLVLALLYTSVCHLSSPRNLQEFPSRPYIYFQMLGYISFLLSLKSSYGCKACDRPYRSNSSDAAWSLISLIFHVLASLIMMIAVPIASLIFSPSSVHLVDKAQIHLYLIHLYIEKAQEMKFRYYRLLFWSLY